MDHVAIMRPSWKLLPKILSGEKTIESRWYKNKRVPWGKIKKGDTVYFKDSGDLVRGRARVSKVKQLQDLTEDKVKVLLEKYRYKLGLRYHVLKHDNKMFVDKKYCILIYLDKVRNVTPFQINKKGFGAMSAWICVNDVESIKILP